MKDRRISPKNVGLKQMFPSSTKASSNGKSMEARSRIMERVSQIDDYRKKKAQYVKLYDEKLF